MTTSNAQPWHCDESTLRGFVDGSVDQVSGAAAETHLMTCAQCRDEVTRLTPPDVLTRAWTGIREAVEVPEPSLVERALRRGGMSGETAGLLAGVPAMRGAWLLGVCCATLFAALATTVSDTLGTATFLVIAPLAPLAGVAASFGGENDPTHELVVTTPYSALRLLLLRTGCVVVSAVPVTVLVGLVLPGSEWLWVAWLAPAAAAVCVTLAAAPLVGHMPAATIVAAAWTFAVGAAVRADAVSALLAPAVQTAFLLVACVAATRVLVRYHSLGHTWRPL